MTAPLDGVRVIEIASWMAAPSACAILADLGADVVKLEPIEGDPMRRKGRQPKVPDRPMIDEPFQVDNRGKRGVAVAIDEPEGAALAAEVATGV